MKKHLLMVLPLLLALAGVPAAAAESGVSTSPGFAGKKVLIAYFSWGGNTKTLAEKINARIGGDMFRIETAEPYPKDYREVAYGVAKKQHDENIHPKLKSNGDVSGYDVVFVGTPAWWHGMAPAVMTFLENNDFSGRILVPFVSHGGGGKYSIPEDMAKLAPGARVLPAYATQGPGDAETDRDIAIWLGSLKTDE